MPKNANVIQEIDSYLKQSSDQSEYFLGPEKYYCHAIKLHPSPSIDIKASPIIALILAGDYERFEKAINLVAKNKIREHLSQKLFDKVKWYEMCHFRFSKDEQESKVNIEAASKAKILHLLLSLREPNNDNFDVNLGKFLSVQDGQRSRDTVISLIARCDLDEDIKVVILNKICQLDALKKLINTVATPKRDKTALDKALEKIKQKKVIEFLKSKGAKTYNELLKADKKESNISTDYNSSFANFNTTIPSEISYHKTLEKRSLPEEEPFDQNQLNVREELQEQSNAMLTQNYNESFVLDNIIPPSAIQQKSLEDKAIQTDFNEYQIELNEKTIALIKSENCQHQKTIAEKQQYIEEQKILIENKDARIIKLEHEAQAKVEKIKQYEDSMRQQAEIIMQHKSQLIKQEEEYKKELAVKDSEIKQLQNYISSQVDEQKTSQIEKLNYPKDNAEDNDLINFSPTHSPQPSKQPPGSISNRKRPSSKDEPNPKKPKKLFEEASPKLGFTFFNSPNYSSSSQDAYENSFEEESYSEDQSIFQKDSSSFEEELLSTDDLKKKPSKIVDNNSENADKFIVHSSPECAAQKWFIKYQKEKRIDSQSRDINEAYAKPFSFSSQSRSRVVGIWGEEAIYLYLKKKYQFKYDAEPHYEPYGFWLSSRKILDINQYILPITITVEFRNKDNYQKLCNQSKAPSPTGPFDLKITWKQNEKIIKEKFIDAKSTPENDASFAFFTKNEIKLIKEREPNEYKVYRIKNACKDEASFEIKKGQKLLQKVEEGTIDYELKIKI